LGLLFGRFGLSVQGIGKAIGVIPKSTLELYLKGNQDQFKEFSFKDFDGDGFSAVKFSLSLSHPIPVKKYFDEFGVGLNVNYYNGIAMAEVTRAEGSLVTTSNAIVSSMDVISRTGQGGSGFGFDLGAAGKIKDDWTVSMVLRNIFAGITWSQQLEENRVTFVVDSIKIGDFGELDSLVSTSTYSIEEFRTRIPLVFHFGVAYDLKDNLTLALDLEQAFEDKLGYSDKAQRVSISVFSIWIWPMLCIRRCGQQNQPAIRQQRILSLCFRYWMLDAGYSIHVYKSDLFIYVSLKGAKTQSSK
jgi:hypothetical protein